ncbi:MAG TPA: protein tyrosine phosphatase [Bacteroidia bacterium]|jgi:protein-tyrosine phosphatase|nr:protein tyrosine phosphatase [Bacteroidia bacterium]
MNILFVCSRNKWRSPTAEAIYKNIPGLNTRSAGTEPSAKIRLSAKMIIWADIIFVMEKRHKQRILEKFEFESSGKEIVVLNIPDDYQFMDPELIEEIKAGVDQKI